MHSAARTRSVASAESNRPGGSIHLAVTKVAGGVRLSVRDTGIGMTPEVMAKIFERFYRADPSRHATGVHAGLGLAIVREYVGRLRGELAVASEANVGSKIEVAVPGREGHRGRGRRGRAAGKLTAVAISYSGE